MGCYGNPRRGIRKAAFTEHMELPPLPIGARRADAPPNDKGTSPIPRQCLRRKACALGAVDESINVVESRRPAAM